MSVLDNFRLWSQTSPEIQEIVSPTVPWRSFNELSPEEKRSVLLHFNRDEYFRGEAGIVYAINSINTLHKKECYAKRTLERWDFLNVMEDFKDIFINRDENIVYELISLYGMGLIAKSEETTLYKYDSENDEEFEKKLVKNAFGKFDDFQRTLNNIFEHYKINVHLTRSGFIPRQEEKIIDDIYEPVLQILTFSKWKDINRDLKDAFEAYGKSTPDGYSECMTHCYSAIQGLLQKIIGKTNISIKDAAREAVASGLIPNDAFSEKALAEMLSVFEQLRMKHSDAHPKEEYANERSAKLMLNLTMVYLQHCLPN